MFNYSVTSDDEKRHYNDVFVAGVIEILCVQRQTTGTIETRVLLFPLQV